MNTPLHDNYQKLQRLAQVLGDDPDTLRSDVEQDFTGSHYTHPDIYKTSRVGRAKLLRASLAKCAQKVRSTDTSLYMELEHIRTQLALLIGDYEVEQ